MASMSDGRASAATISVERVTRYAGTDLDDLCEATESAIVEGGGFGWLKAPPRQVLENYWKGMLLVPERRLVVGRLDGVIAGSVQLSRAPRNNEAQAFAGTITALFVAPWARGRGIGRGILIEIERLAREETPLTADTALRLSRYFGTTAAFWMGVQAQYDLEIAADQINKELKRIEPRRAA